MSIRSKGNDDNLLEPFMVETRYVIFLYLTFLICSFLTDPVGDSILVLDNPEHSGHYGEKSSHWISFIELERHGFKWVVILLD